MKRDAISWTIHNINNALLLFPGGLCAADGVAVSCCFKVRCWMKWRGGEKKTRKNHAEYEITRSRYVSRWMGFHYIFSCHREHKKKKKSIPPPPFLSRPVIIVQSWGGGSLKALLRSRGWICCEGIKDCALYLCPVAPRRRQWGFTRETDSEGKKCHRRIGGQGGGVQWVLFILIYIFFSLKAKPASLIITTHLLYAFTSME